MSLLSDETLQYPAKIAGKVSLDKALNLSELAQVTGWSRGTLAKLGLPLVAGKIPFSEFNRIMRRVESGSKSDPTSFSK